MSESSRLKTENPNSETVPSIFSDGSYAPHSIQFGKTEQRRGGLSPLDKNFIKKFNEAGKKKKENLLEENLNKYGVRYIKELFDIVYPKP